MKATEQLRERKAEFDKAAADFEAHYPQYVEAARLSLNSLFNEADYPPTHAIRKRFDYNVEVRNLPDKTDFRVKLDSKYEQAVLSSIRDSVDRRLEGAMKDLWQRVYKVVSDMIERLDNLREGRRRHPGRLELIPGLVDCL